MRWISHEQAQVAAFGAPDAQEIAFRLPGHLGQDRVHLLARAAFGYRAEVQRSDGSWVVQRRPFHDGRARRHLENERRRRHQRLLRRAFRNSHQAIQLRGGL